MSLDNQPKSPLNMNYLLEQLSSPRRSAFFRLRRPTLTGTSPRARFGRLNRRNMKQRGTASSSISVGLMDCRSMGGLAITPLLLYSITVWEDLPCSDSPL